MFEAEWQIQEFFVISDYSLHNMQLYDTARTYMYTHTCSNVYIPSSYITMCLHFSTSINVNTITTVRS